MIYISKLRGKGKRNHKKKRERQRGARGKGSQVIKKEKRYAFYTQRGVLHEKYFTHGQGGGGRGKRGIEEGGFL